VGLGVRAKLHVQLHRLFELLLPVHRLMDMLDEDASQDLLVQVLVSEE